MGFTLGLGATKFVVAALYIVILLLSTSCNHDSHLDDRCGTGARFSPSLDGGPCDRCATEDGYVRMGREGQFCYEPGEYGGKGAALRLLTWETPPPYTPVDSFILDIDPTSSSIPSVPYSRSGNLHSGYPNDDDRRIWGFDRCYDIGMNQIFGCCSFVDLDLSTNDTLLPDGTAFSFEMLEFDVDQNCIPDWGHAVGEFQDGRGVATVYWRPFIVGQKYDTVRIDTLYLDQLPDEWM